MQCSLKATRVRPARASRTPVQPFVAVAQTGFSGRRSPARRQGNDCQARPDSAARLRTAAAITDELELSSVDAEKRDIQRMLNKPYKYGFKTIIESDTFPVGLSEDVVAAISLKKKEPEWMLEFRLKAYRRWLTMEEPDWSDNSYPRIDFQGVSYYSEPKIKEKLDSLDQVDPELLRTFDKLGIPLNEQKRMSNVAVDAVFDSVSIATTFRADLLKHGVVFMSISEAIREYPDLIKKHMGSVVSGPNGVYGHMDGMGWCHEPTYPDHIV